MAIKYDKILDALREQDAWTITPWQSQILTDLASVPADSMIYRNTSWTYVWIPIWALWTVPVSNWPWLWVTFQNIWVSWFNWFVVTTNQTWTVNTWYITNWASKIDISLPATSSVWDIIKVTADNINWWRITQWAWQIIWIWNLFTTSWITWNLESTDIWDSIELVCVMAWTYWREVSMQWNLTVN